MCLVGWTKWQVIFFFKKKQQPKTTLYVKIEYIHIINTVYKMFTL